MRIVIIEDEIHASDYLMNLIGELRPDAEVVAQLRSIRDAMYFLTTEKEPDLIFSDIRLLDGLSFEIFKTVKLKSKIVFVTAYDEYVMDSFEYNNIYYLLKPIKKQDLIKAFEKYDNLALSQDTDLLLPIIQSTLLSSKKANAIMIETGDSIIPVRIDDIMLAASSFKLSEIYLRDGQRYPCDLNLKKLEEILGEDDFVRASRQWIVRKDAIQSIVKLTTSKYKIVLKPGCAVHEIETVKDRVDRIISSFS